MLTMDCPLCDASVRLPDAPLDSMRCDACSVVVDFATDEPAAELAAAA